ncbi:hypothetical protein [Natronococcus occultus]|uniref:Uncharacterized protein n=1 Tax=Natronococcus occultus SP4 TaxID=694430 RepID=L0K629_9EURY|nr:hypothetical protein [Natronococcus occultus]AGB39588.1 hypothetical protein Natoc_3888 [Natronococcus occultus SP4]
MRLTPFRKNSSSDSSGDESTVQASTSVRVLEYDESSIVSDDRETETSTTGPATELEWNVVSLLESRNGPVTIDEIVDQLYDASGTDDVEAWGDIHERLSQTDLPALDASGVIEFYPERGTVTLADNHTTSQWNYALTGVLAMASVLFLVPVIFEVTAVVSVVGLLVACLGVVTTIYR